MRSFWLCKKASRKRALRINVVRPITGVPSVEFEIFEPRTEKDVRGGTVSRAKATCVCCGTVLAPDHVALSSPPSAAGPTRCSIQKEIGLGEHGCWP